MGIFSLMGNSPSPWLPTSQKGLFASAATLDLVTKKLFQLFRVPVVVTSVAWTPVLPMISCPKMTESLRPPSIMRYRAFSGSGSPSR